MRRYSRFGWFLITLLIVAGSVWASPARQTQEFRSFLLNARADLEVLANDVLGEGVRPQTWTFNLDPTSRTFVADLWFDNEQLSDSIFGPGQRPVGWIGATSSNAQLIARNVRHDLELASRRVWEEAGEARPAEWRGAAPVYRCDRTLQNLVFLLDIIYQNIMTTPQSAFDYCATLDAEISDQIVRIVERTATAETEREIPELVLAVRGDLERLADEKKGLNTRPANWIGNRDINSPTLIGDNFLDLENLANDQLGQNVRPPDWIGYVTNSPAISYRNLRHDLELLADLVMGAGVRPRGWQGEDTLARCEPKVQNLVFIVQQNYEFVITDEMRAAPDFCQAVELAANNSAENPPVEDIEAAQESKYIGEAQYAFAYLDVAALQYMGQMPPGTKFRAWYRNYGGSTMMFVSGDNFAVFIDRRWTTLSQDIFNTLPSLEGVKPLTFCDARWCNGPGPTPTPTGAGALEAIVRGATPPATLSPGEVGQQGKTQVSWNHIRVTYLLDKADIGVAQVTLEICAEPAQISCEPVTRVFDNATGTNKPVVSVSNGLNVYEFPYGYSANLIIEGATRFSPDVWISDPTIR